MAVEDKAQPLKCRRSTEMGTADPGMDRAAQLELVHGAPTNSDWCVNGRCLGSVVTAFGHGFAGDQPLAVHVL